MKAFKFGLTYLIDFIMTILAIIMIVAFSQTYLGLFQGGFFAAFWEYIKLIFKAIFMIDQLKVETLDGTSISFMDVVGTQLPYSLAILAGALCMTFIAALLLEFLHYFLPLWGKKLFRGMAIIIQSIPDVVLIFSLQLSAIWFYKKTGWLVIDPIAGFDNIYLMPILTLAIFPIVMLFQMIDVSVSEEENKNYVEYAFAKGFSKGRIFFRHILRNTVLTIFSNMQLLFWLMISNLLIMENLFNMNGFMKQLYFTLAHPSVFVVGLICIFIPFYFLDALGKVVVKRINGDAL